MAVAEAPLTVAIVGSGPSGFYAAGALLDNPDLDVRVDMFERLATPWGLVRFGVAPDHPKIKSVSSVYAKIAAQESFRFFGNVEVGGGISGDITRDELTERYDAVIYAVGTASWASPARSCPAAWPPWTSWAGTTGTPTTPTSPST